MMGNSEKVKDIMRGEKSAVETYVQVLEKVQGQPGASDLQRFCDDHQDSLNRLSQYVPSSEEAGGTDSGAWGTFAQAVTGTAKVFGNKAALKALKEGEEHGLKQYQELLNAEEVDASVQQMVASDLIPRQQEHIRRLDELMRSA